MQPLDHEVRLGLTAQIVSAYVGHHELDTSRLSALIGSVSATLGDLNAPPSTPPVPAVPVKKSITFDRITCLDCGQKLKTLRRHIRTAHGIEPDDYRAKWRLPGDYPLTAPAYSESRAALAKASGLGTRAQKIVKKGRR